MADPTLEELKAMQAAVAQGYAKIEHPRCVEADALLAALLTAADTQRLREIVRELPDSGVKNALANVASSMEAARSMLSFEIPRIAELLPPPAGATPPSPGPEA